MLSCQCGEHVTAGAVTAGTALCARMVVYDVPAGLLQNSAFNVILCTHTENSMRRTILTTHTMKQPCALYHEYHVSAVYLLAPATPARYKAFIPKGAVCTLSAVFGSSAGGMAAQAWTWKESQCPPWLNIMSGALCRDYILSLRLCIFSLSCSLSCACRMGCPTAYLIPRREAGSKKIG